MNYSNCSCTIVHTPISLTNGSISVISGELSSNRSTAITLKAKRIYIRVEFTRKKCKMAISLYCFHTAGVLHIFVLYNLLGPGISFYRKSKINVKRKPNYEIGWFHN